MHTRRFPVIRLQPASRTTRAWRTIAPVEGGSVVAASRLLVLALSCVTVLAAAACGASPANKSGAAQEPKARVLTLATALNDPEELVPFTDAVARLSHGALRIERRTGSHAGEVEYENGLIADVQAGKSDLGVVGSRAFDSVGVTAFEPLDAPLLIDSYALQQKVLGSSLVEPMLGALDQIGLAGIGMIPGPLRKPLGTGGPLLAPADFHGLSIGVQQSRIASETMKALGGDPHWFAVEGDASGFDAIDSQVSAIQGNGYDAKGSSLTTNVNLWPRPMVVFAGAKLLASLSADEQHVLREAATSTVATELGFVQTGEEEHARILCRRGNAGFVVATDAQLAALRDAVRPVYDLIGAGAGNNDAIATIESLKRAVAAAPDGLETCSTEPAAAVASPTPLDGAWRFKSSIDEAEALGDPNPVPENYGTFVYVFDRGRFAFTQEGGSACTWGYGSFVVDDKHLSVTFEDGGGIAPTNAYNRPGEHFVFGWSIYKDALHLTGVPGEISPENFRAHPAHRLSSHPNPKYLNQRCAPPKPALAQ